MTDRALASKHPNPAAAASVLEQEIDELVHALHGLTPEEIKIMEGAANELQTLRPRSAGNGTARHPAGRGQIGAGRARARRRGARGMELFAQTRSIRTFQE